MATGTLDAQTVSENGNPLMRVADIVNDTVWMPKRGLITPITVLFTQSQTMPNYRNYHLWGRSLIQIPIACST